MNLPADATGEADAAGVLAVEARAVPDPPDEDRFDLVGHVVARSTVLGLEIDHGGAASVQPLESHADDRGSRPTFGFTAEAYQTAPGFPVVSLRILTEAGTSRHTVHCTPPDPKDFKPVFEAGLVLPQGVCIVGSGPSAVQAMARRPTGMFTIALNKAVLLPGLRPDLWLMNQLTSDSLGYYREAAAAHPQVPRLFRLSTALATAQEHTGRDDCFWFLARQSPTEELRADGDLPPGPLVRSGGTVAGCALQIAFALGAREILLGGIDMHGDTYWDGTTNPRDPKPGVWRHAAILDRLIAHLCRSYGGEVLTLGDTALRSPTRWPPA